MWVKIFFVRIIIYVLSLFLILSIVCHILIHCKTKEWIISMKINARKAEVKIDLVLYPLLDRVIFVSWYLYRNIDDDITVRICCDMSYHVECSWKIWYTIWQCRIYIKSHWWYHHHDISNGFGCEKKKREIGEDNAFWDGRGVRGGGGSGSGGGGDIYYIINSQRILDTGSPWQRRHIS